MQTYTALAGAALALAGVDEPWEASLPIAQPSRYERAKKFGRDAWKFGLETSRDARKFAKEGKKSAKKWMAA